MYCEHCGKELKDDSLFCEYCGTKVVAEKLSKEKKNVNVKEWILLATGIAVVVAFTFTLFIIMETVFSRKIIQQNESAAESINN